MGIFFHSELWIIYIQNRILEASVNIFKYLKLKSSKFQHIYIPNGTRFIFLNKKNPIILCFDNYIKKQTESFRNRAIQN